MNRTVSIDEMDSAIMDELEKYAELASDDLKAAGGYRKVQEKLVGKKCP